MERVRFANSRISPSIVCVAIYAVLIQSSIESQIDFCKYELKGGSCRVFKDKGYSGKNTDRPEFQKLLGEIRKGKVRRVIVYKLDRISRSILDFATMMELFQEYRFYHKNLLTEMDNRDFESVEQMNEVMIEKWNKKVHARDEVVILGDLSLGNGKETNEILCRLKGRLCLIRGNHDERYLRDRDFDASRFE